MLRQLADKISYLNDIARRDIKIWRLKSCLNLISDERKNVGKDPHRYDVQGSDTTMPGTDKMLVKKNYE